MCSNIPFIDPQSQFDYAVMHNVMMTLTSLGLWKDCRPGNVTAAWKALAKTWCSNVDDVAIGWGPLWASPQKGYEVTKEILMVLDEVLQE